MWGLTFRGAKARNRVLALAAAVLVYIWRVRRSRPRRCATIPLFKILVGFLKAVARCGHHDFFVRLHQLYGRTFALKMPFGAWAVVTTCPKNVEHILKSNFDNYPKGDATRSVLSELMGNGIFNADGQAWYHQRKVASKMFTANLFKEHIWHVVHRNGRKLRDILERSERGKAVDIFNLMNRFTLDTIGEIGFGKCIGSLDDPTSPFLRSFDRAQQISFARFVFPFWKVARALRVGPEKDTHEHFGRLDRYSREVVRNLQSLLENSGTKGGGISWADIEGRKSFVGLFLEDAKKRGEVLSEDYLRDMVINFLIAGRDTTAQALSWTFYLLCLHPEVQARARKEVIDICGVRGPAYEDMNRLPYLQAVVSEALRLYPSVPWDGKIAERDDEMPDGTLVRGGSIVIYDMYGMGRDKGIWGEDAAMFRPERWLEMEQVPDSYHYPVFNGGPRECLGKRLAWVEMKTCLGFVLPHVSLELAVAPDQITPDAQLTIGLGSGLPCYVTLVDGDGDAVPACTQGKRGRILTPSEPDTDDSGPRTSDIDTEDVDALDVRTETTSEVSESATNEVSDAQAEASA